MLTNALKNRQCPGPYKGDFGQTEFSQSRRMRHAETVQIKLVNSIFRVRVLVSDKLKINVEGVKKPEDSLVA